MRGEVLLLVECPATSSSARHLTGENLMPHAPFYFKPEWRALRARFLSEHPHCRVCAQLGLLVAAVEVDHIIPIAKGGAQLDARNLQALCKLHHGQKTRAQKLGRQLLVFNAQGEPVDVIGRN